MNGNEEPHTMQFLDNAMLMPPPPLQVVQEVPRKPLKMKNRDSIHPLDGRFWFAEIVEKIHEGEKSSRVEKQILTGVADERKLTSAGSAEPTNPTRGDKNK